MSKARNYQLTLNEVENYEGLLAYLRSLKPGYLISCKEIAPSTGHEHIHVYVQFATPKALSVKKVLGAHIEKCRGSPQQNVAYIKKDGDIIDEEGTLRSAGAKSIGEIEKMSPDQRKELPAQLYNIVQKIEAKESSNLLVKNIYKENIAVYWYWGESGAGKTRKAMREIGEREFNMVKYEDGFWHGLGTANIALYDDFRDSHMKPTELINFIDYYVHPMNIKGGSHQNTYQTIYITSLQSPEEIYKNVPEESKKQWLRRIKEIIHFEISQ